MDCEKHRETGRVDRHIYTPYIYDPRRDLLQSLSHISLWLPWFIGDLSVLRQGHCKRDHINLQRNPLLALDESKAWLQIPLAGRGSAFIMKNPMPLQTDFCSSSRLITAPPVREDTAVAWGNTFEQYANKASYTKEAPKGRGMRWNVGIQQKPAVLFFFLLLLEAAAAACLGLVNQDETANSKSLKKVR